MIISHSFLLRMRNVLDKIVEKITPKFYVQFFFENRAVYEITWENTVNPDRPQMTVRRMRFACWTPKAIDTHP